MRSMPPARWRSTGRISQFNLSVLLYCWFDEPGVTYAVQAKDTLDAPWSSILRTAVGDGGLLEVSIPIETMTRFVRLIQAP